jgi:hypothetical protein
MCLDLDSIEDKRIQHAIATIFLTEKTLIATLEILQRYKNDIKILLMVFSTLNKLIIMKIKAMVDSYKSKILKDEDFK